jgi:hypothetical protein
LTAWLSLYRCGLKGFSKGHRQEYA